jgi:murein hydrolase activator
VTGVITIPGAGKAIIVRHGEYLTVYSNLESTAIKSGDKVKTKQSIGTVSADDDGKSEMHLEIWKGSVMLNPESWIFKQ